MERRAQQKKNPKRRAEKEAKRAGANTAEADVGLGAGGSAAAASGTMEEAMTMAINTMAKENLIF